MKNKVIAVIQARTGSSRLPGKVLSEISEKPMLWHVVDRLKHANTLDSIIIATTDKQKDDCLADFCGRHGILVSRGSEEDVLDRYYKAAKEYRAEVVVRITGDCPLVDPEIVDNVVSSYLKNSNNLAGASNTIERTYPRGLDAEAVSFLALQETWKNAREPYQREHVTTYIYEHPKVYKMLSVKHDENLSYLRWTVDEEADLRFVREIYERLYKKNSIFLTNNVLEVLKKEPSLAKINKNVKQKLVV